MINEIGLDLHYLTGLNKRSWGKIISVPHYVTTYIIMKFIALSVV